MSPEGLAAARVVYLRAIRELGPTDAVAAIVQAYLDAPGAAPSLKVTAGNHRVSQKSRDLAAMAVGDKILVRGHSATVVRHRFGTARAILGNPDAAWRTLTLPCGAVEVLRLPDGSPVERDPTLNPKAVEMASLAVGQSVLSKTITAVRGGNGGGAMNTTTKSTARKILGNPAADWSVTQRSNGVRLARLPDRDLTMPWPPAADVIIQAAARKHRITISTMKSQNRTSRVSAARVEAWQGLFATGLWSNAEIGAWFDRSANSVAVTRSYHLTGKRKAPA